MKPRSLMALLIVLTVDTASPAPARVLPTAGAFEGLRGSEGRPGQKENDAVPPPPATNLSLPPEFDGKTREVLEQAIEDLEVYHSEDSGRDLDRIIRNLRRADKQLPHSPLPKYHLGVAYQMDEKYQKAREVLERALELNPEFYEAWVELGDVCVWEKNPAEAIPLYDKALAIYPYYETGLWRKAATLIQLGRLPEADEVYARLHKVKPTRLLDAIREKLARAIEGPDWAQTYTAETENYVVTTGTTQEFANDIAACAEQVRRLYGKYFDEIDRIGRKYHITVYQSKEEYQKHGASPSAGGHYDPLLRMMYLFRYDQNSDTLLVLYHEGFHQYLHEYLDNIPQWFNEGLGDFFGGAIISPSGRKAQMGPNPWRVELIKKAVQLNRCPTARDLMNMSQQQMYGKDASIHYAQAWAIIYYCMESGKSAHRTALKNYFTLLRKGAGQRLAYQKTFGRIDMQRFEKSWRNFVDKLPGHEEIMKRREQ